jgi:hypothetical protein
MLALIQIVYLGWFLGTFIAATDEVVTTDVVTTDH